MREPDTGVWVPTDQRPALPEIPGYRVWLGRVQLHARHEGPYRQAVIEGRPWHVVAPTARDLVEAVNRGHVQP